MAKAYSTSTNIIESFLKHDFIPALSIALEQKITQQNIVKNLPELVTNKMYEKFIISTVENAAASNNFAFSKNAIKKIHEPKQCCEIIEVHNINDNSSIMNPVLTPLNKQAKKKKRTKLSQTTNNKMSQCIKLDQQQIQQESEQVKNARRLKSKMKQYFAQIKQRKQDQDQRQKFIKWHKQKAVKETKSHTYDYESNILNVPAKEIQARQKTQNYQIVQSNEIPKVSLKNTFSKANKNKKELSINTKQQKNINSYQISQKKKVTIQSEQQSDHSKQIINKKQVEIIPRQIRPFYPFQISNIVSLSQNIDQKSISSKVKIKIQQQKLIQNGTKDRKEYFLSKKLVIKKGLQQKKKDKESKSIIFNMNIPNSNRKNSQIINTISDELMESRISKRIRSLQLSDHEQKNTPRDTLSLQKRFLNKQNTSTLDLENITEEKIKLPLMKKIDRNSNKKRKLTEEQYKSFNSLSQIEIQPNLIFGPSSMSSRNYINSAFAGKKKETQSSIQQKECGSLLGLLQKNVEKKYVRQYFNNYKKQFQHKIHKYPIENEQQLLLMK